MIYFSYIFDARLGKTGAELLRVFILGTLVNLGSRSGFDYEPGIKIKEAANQIGFADEHIIHVLSDLCEMRFVQTASHGSAEYAASFYATQLGGHILRDFIGQFAFVENMLMDTFIADEKVWNELLGLSQSIKSERNISKRLNFRVTRVLVFYNYMVQLYEPIVEQARLRLLAPEWCTNPLKDMEETLKADCNRAKSSADRHYG